MSEQTRMTKSMVIKSLKDLNKATGRKFTVSSNEFSENGTTYGLVRKNGDGTRQVILPDEFTKREVYYHIQGFLILMNEVEGER